MPEEFLNKHASMLLADRHWRAQLEHADYADESDGPFSVNSIGSVNHFVGERLNGDHFPLECIVTRAKLKGGVIRVVLLRDVTEQRELEEQLSNAAHKAGMADMATGVLHNIGNVLNSVSVSGEEIATIIANSKIDGLVKANELMFRDIPNIGKFVNEDPKGKLLPDYYQKIAYQLKTEIEMVDQESQALNDKITMMRDVISTQQSYARSGYYFEETSVKKVVDDSIRVLENSLFKRNVKVTKDYDDVPNCMAQKSKLAQVITNIIKNAIEAMDNNDVMNREKRLSIRLSRENQDSIRLEIEDNGQGIDEVHINNVFRHGFTTKITGHGFGLHTCANSMTEMGGSIQVESNGLEKGACFILIMPIKKPDHLKDSMIQVA